MTTTSHLTAEEVRVRRAHLVVAATVLTVCAAAYVSAAVVLAGELPVRVATHFGVDGAPDDWMSRGAALWVGGLVAVGLPLLLLVTAAAGQWWRGVSSRVATAFIAGIAVFLATLFVLLYAAQRGLTDGADARVGPSIFLWAVGAAVLVGLLVAAVLPRPLPQPEPVLPEALEVRPSDAVVWFGRARPSHGVLGLLLGIVALVALVALAAGEWWLWIVVLATAAVTLSMMSFAVRVDRRGLSWRSALGWPRGGVPLAEVTGVSVREVRTGDFGGYGVRLVPGTTGIVTRTGPALEVRRGERRGLVVTVDDAAIAASVLEGLRRRP